MADGDNRQELRLRVNGEKPLAELTTALNDFCDAAHDRGAATVVIAIGVTSPERRSWPDSVRIGEVNRWERAVRRLERLRCASLAVAHGICGGPALDLFLATDYRIVAPDLKLLLPVNDGQFWPGMALYRLVNQAGLGRGRELVLWGSALTAEQVRSIGLVDEVSSDVEAAVRAAQVLFARLSGTEIAIRRQLLMEATTSTYEEALGVHLAACDRELRRLNAPGSRPEAERIRAAPAAPKPDRSRDE